MKLPFLAVLLAFAIPLPTVDFFTPGADEDVLVESARLAKAPQRREPVPASRVPSPPETPRPCLVFDPGLPPRCCADWSPRRFCRPPPL